MCCTIIPKQIPAPIQPLMFGSQAAFHSIPAGGRRTGPRSGLCESFSVIQTIPDRSSQRQRRA